MRHLALVIAMVTLAVSCSSTQANPSAQTDVSAPESLKFDGGAEVLRIAMVQPDSVEPADLVLTDQAQVILSDLLYDGLTEVEANSGRLRPGLAKSWVPNEDFTAWTFELEPSRLTAEQVKPSFERQGNQQSAIVRDLMSNIDTVEVLSEFEIRFELTRSSAAFPWLLSGPGMAVGSDSDESSGRLKLISQDNNGMVLASPDGLSDIDIRWAETEQDAFALLDSGEVNLAVGAAESSPSAPALGHVRFVAINSASSNLPTPADRAFVSSIVGSVGVAKSTSASIVEIDGLSSPALAGSSTSTCGQPCSFSNSLALQPTSNDIALKLGVSSEADLPVAEMIRQALVMSNMTVEVVQTNPEGLARMIADGEVDISLFGWVAGAGSVDAVVPSLLRSSSPANIFQLQNDQVDQLLVEASEVGDDQQRWDLIAEAESLAISTDIVVPIGAIRSKVWTDNETTSLVIRADGTLDTFRY